MRFFVLRQRRNFLDSARSTVNLKDDASGVFRGILRYGTARHGGDALLLAGVGVLGVRPDGLGGTRGVLLAGLGVVVGGGPPGDFPRRRSHVEHAAFALQVAAF